MQPTHPLLNSIFNQIHYWSEPDQNPLKRMFLTRISEIGCALIEAASISYKILELSVISGKEVALFSSKAAIKIFPDSKKLQNSCNRPSFFNEIKMKGYELCKLIAGVVSTLCIGLLLSPETNFKIHLKLELVIDNLAEKMQRKIAAKVQNELQIAEIALARKKRFETLEIEKERSKIKETQANAVESRLAELLLLS